MSEMKVNTKLIAEDIRNENKLKTNHIVQEVLRELQSAVEKYKPFNSAHEGFSIMNEEVDEMWDEVKKDDPERAIEEAIQVAAMAIRFIKDIRTNRNLNKPYSGQQNPKEKV